MFKINRRLICFLMTVFAVVACDDEVEGDSYPGANSLKCTKNIESYTLHCVEINPLTGPLGGTTVESAIYGDGEVEEVLWEKTGSWFFKSDEHLYGFDVDPLVFSPSYAGKEQNIYISVKKGDSAFLRIYVDPKAKEQYRLHEIDENREIVTPDVYTGTDICENKNCVKEVSLLEGTYAVFYGKVDKKIDVHVLGYDWDSSQVDYVQFGDAGNPACDYGVENGCYTRDRLEEHFNEIYKQAVVKRFFKEWRPSELGFKDVLSVDLTDNMSTVDRMWGYLLQIKKSLDPELKRRYDKYEEKFFLWEPWRKKYDELEKIYNECKRTHDRYTMECLDEKIALDKVERDMVKPTQNKDNAYELLKDYLKTVKWNDHFVMGINEMSVEWTFVGRDGTSDYIFKSYKDYKKACTVFYKKEYDEGCLHMRFPMRIRDVTYGCRSNCEGKIEAEMIDFDEKENEFHLKFHNLPFELYSEREYVLSADVFPFVPDNPYALQYTAVISSKKNSDGLPTPGGYIIGGLVWGAHVSGENSLNVISHEIGHSYGLSDIYVSEADPTFSGLKSTDETNLMNYITPIGPKIRYRPLEVVYTSRNERIKRDGKYATESQWECIRSNKKCIVQY